MYGHLLPIRNTGTGQMRSYAASVLGGLSRRESKVEAENEFATRPLRATEIDARRHPRFKLGVDIVIHSRTCGVLKGHTVDISETGISAILRIEVPVGEVVDLDFTLPFGTVTTYARVRQRSAFRYGFQFLELRDGEAIRRTCRQLAVEQALITPDSQ